MEDSRDLATIKYLRKAIATADDKVFSTILQEFIQKTMSYSDMPASEPERSYHLFVLGLLVILTGTYIIKSNKESGLGRYDILLIPHDKKALASYLHSKKLSKKRPLNK